MKEAKQVQASRVGQLGGMQSAGLSQAQPPAG